MTILITIRTKGGPGSGNWGHRGIPGKVGGSSPRGVGLSPTSGKDWLERYEKRTGKKHPKAESGLTPTEGLFGGVAATSNFLLNGPGKPILADVKGDANRRMLARAIENARIPVSHLHGATVSTQLPYQARGIYSEDESGNYYEHGVGKLNGLYYVDDKSIHVSRKAIGTPVPHTQRTFMHELGHHVTIHAISPSSKLSVANAWNSEVLSNMRRQLRLKSKSASKSKAMKSLSDMGLRRYSLTSKLEFMADVYKATILGKPEQRAALSKFLGVADVSKLFDISSDYISPYDAILQTKQAFDPTNVWEVVSKRVGNVMEVSYKKVTGVTKAMYNATPWNYKLGE